MADLSGQTIASSYEQLLSLPDGGGNANTLVAVTDGDGGTTFGIKLATNKVEIIPGSNDTNAFEVSQADGTAVLTVDSTNARVSIGTSSTSQKLTISTTSSDDGIELISTNGGSVGPTFESYHNAGQGNAAAGDFIFVQRAYGDNDRGTGGGGFEKIEFGNTSFQASDVGDGSEDSKYRIGTMKNGTLATRFIVDGDAVGIGTESPSSKLHINDGGLRVVGSNERILVIEDGGQNSVELGHSTSSTHDGFVALTDDSGATQVLLTSGTTVNYINNGNVGINTSNPTNLFTVKSGGAGQIVKGIVLENNGDTNIAGTIFEESFSGGTCGELRLNSSNSLKVLISGNSNSYIHNGANFGIGTNSPTGAKLQIDDVQSGDIGLQITQAQAEPGLFIDQNGNNRGLKVESTGSASGAAIFSSNIGSSATQPLVKMETENSDFDQNVLLIIQDGAKDALFVDMNANDNAISVTSDATSARGISIAMNSLTTGNIANFQSDSPDNSSRFLVNILNDNPSATGAIGLYIQNDASAGAELINGYSDARHFLQRLRAGNSSYDSAIFMSEANRTANANYFFYKGQSDADGTPDLEFSVTGVGEVQGDTAYATPTSDYAEYFESKDGLAISVGTTVKLDGEKIVACKDGDTPIGVIRPNGTSSVVGNNAWNRWKGKYLKDSYGAYLWEEYSATTWEEGDDKKYYHSDRIPSSVTVPSDAVVTSTETDGSKLMRKKLNPDWDESKTYVSREDRDEWNIVGLMGQVEITKGQPVASNWIKMKDISDTVELWFIK
jgi:hypothetical protein